MAPRRSTAPRSAMSLAQLAIAALLGLALLLAARPAEAARALRQVDSSIRQENAGNKMIGALRRTGGDPNAAQASLATFGKGNFEKSADLHTALNLANNLKRYAKPTDNGARGQVAARIHSKLAKNYDGDTEDGVNFIQQAAQKNVRLTLSRSDREREATQARAAEAAAPKQGDK